MKRLINLKTKSVILGVFYLTIFRRIATAYLDPGSGSLIIQVIVGVLAGLIMVIKVNWQKIKSLFGRTSSDNTTPDEQQENE